MIWKRRLANLIRLRFMRQLMSWGILVFTPRQRVGVGIVVLNEKHEVLLLRHVFHPNFPWGLPGGWLQRHEDPAAGALRELKEETGLTAVLGPVIHIQREEYPPHVGIAFMGFAQPGDIILSGEIIEASWVAPQNLPPLLPFTATAIENSLSRMTELEGNGRYEEKSETS